MTRTLQTEAFIVIKFLGTTMIAETYVSSPALGLETLLPLSFRRSFTALILCHACRSRQKNRHYESEPE